jgi:hypothetical protein
MLHLLPSLSHEVAAFLCFRDPSEKRCIVHQISHVLQSRQSQSRPSSLSRQIGTVLLKGNAVSAPSYKRGSAACQHGCVPEQLFSFPVRHRASTPHPVGMVLSRKTKAKQRQ